MKQTRIYVVTQDNATAALIRAQSVGQALAHYTRKHIAVELAGQDALIAATKAGIEPEDAKADPNAADAAQAQVRG